MEAPEKGETAENVARYFASGSGGRKASAHYCVDNNSIVQCVRDSDIAYHAPGANHNGIGIELAGYAKQTRGEWLDAYSTAMLKQAAVLTRNLCLEHQIPVRYVDANGLQRGVSGITTHAQVSAAFKKSSHTDPGPNFPMDTFLVWVQSTPSPYEEDDFMARISDDDLQRIINMARAFEGSQGTNATINNIANELRDVHNEVKGNYNWRELIGKHIAKIKEKLGA